MGHHLCRPGSGWALPSLLAIALALLGSLAGAQELGETPRLYFFTAAGCGPCKQLEPTLLELQRRGYAVTKIDVGQHPDWADAFDVTQTPTCVITAGQRNLGSLVGSAGLDTFVSALDQAYRIVGHRPPTEPAVQTQQIPAAHTNAVQPSVQREPRENHQPLAATPPWPTPGQRAQDRNADRLARQISDAAVDRAFRATVRIRVEDASGVSNGTGTIIDTRNNRALVLTCGHIFRDADEKSSIRIEYGFADGNIREVPGRLVKCDWDSRDVGLISMPLEERIEPAPLDWGRDTWAAGTPVFSIGCSQGDNPTVRECEVLRVARYGIEDNPETALKIDTSVRPVVGRSGGGLFDANGVLIGVCNAAAIHEDEGIYSAVENVQWQLDQAGIAHLFQEIRPSNSVAKSGSPNPLSSGSQGGATSVPASSLATSPNKPLASRISLDDGIGKWDPAGDHRQSIRRTRRLA